MSPQDPPGDEGTEGRASEDWRSELRFHHPSPEVETYAATLALIIATFGLLGIGGDTDLARTALAVLIAATVDLSLRVARAQPRVRLVLTAIAVAVAVATALQALIGNVNDGATRLLDSLLLLLALPAILVGVIRRLRATQAVTIEAVLGVVSVYLLLGMFFAFVYGSMDRLGAGSFFAQNVTATASRCQYYSFTTLATVGYGDLTARTNLGHTLSVAEALLGQVYLVTVVSLIVGNLGRRRAARAE
jgi:hypothetical protein